jgi:predicted transcriptional regulator
MPRATEKGKIIALHGEGCGLQEIARKLTRSHKVVSNFLRKPETYGTNKKGSPKKKLSPRTERRLVKISHYGLVGAETIDKTQCVRIIFRDILIIVLVNFALQRIEKYQLLKRVVEY